MWKLMILGFVVQLVLLASILDVNFFDNDDGGVQFRDKTPCARNLMVVVIEGLEYDDIVQANGSRAVSFLVPNSTTYRVNVSSPENDTIDLEGSIFDEHKVLYVGPPATPYQFNTTLWDFVMIKDNNDTYDNTSQLSESSYVSNRLNRRVVIHHMVKIIESNQLDYYPVKFINIGRSSSIDESLTPEERIWYFSKTYELIRNATRSPYYIFIVASSMSLLVRNSTQDHFEDYLLIHGHSDCISEERTEFFKQNITYDDAYNLIDGYVTLTAIKKEAPVGPYHQFTVEGNLLEFVAGRAFEMQQTYSNFGLYFTGWDTLNSVFQSLDSIETDTSPVVIAFTVFLFLMWISFLSVKTLNMVLESFKGEAQVNSIWLRYVNVLSLILLVIFGIATKLDGCPYRYVVYFSAGVLVCRLLCGEFLSSAMIQSEPVCSLSDKVNIGVQLGILAITVECLFWAIHYHKILIIVFVLAAIGRIIQGVFSVSSLKKLIAFATATFFISLQYLLSFSYFGGLVNLNLSAGIWAIMGAVAIKFLVTKSNHDRFMMFLCILELLMATSFTNVFLVYGFSYYSIVPVVGFFAVVSFLLPLFGGPDPKYRLLEVAVSTSAVFTFFSCSGESIFLLSSFTVCFCSYLLDRDSQKKLPDDVSYYSIIPATFHAILLILACHVVTPGGGQSLLRAFSIMSPDSPYHLIASGLFYFFKLGFMVNLLEATFLSSGPKLVTLPNLLIVVIILNLISLRAFVQYSMFPSRMGKADVFINHILLHAVAALTFYLYPFVQVLCNTCLFSICQRPRTTFIPPEPMN